MPGMAWAGPPAGQGTSPRSPIGAAEGASWGSDHDEEAERSGRGSAVRHAVPDGRRGDRRMLVGRGSRTNGSGRATGCSGDLD